MRHEWMNPDNLHFDKKSDALLFLRHKKAYEIAIDKIKGKHVLEIGSGSGFGTGMLAKHAETLIAVDRDDDALNYARENNTAENITFLKADIIKEGLKFDNNTFDYVILYQVFEHIHPDSSLSFLESIKRVLKPGGCLLLTTPNRKTRLFPFQKPVNKYHQIEYTAKKLKKTLTQVFDSIDFSGLRATKEIQKIEKKRVKPTFINTYLKSPIKKILPQSITSQLVNKNISKKKLKDTADIKTGQDIFFGFVTNDFYLDAKTLNKSLDFYAICKK